MSTDEAGIRGILPHLETFLRTWIDTQRAKSNTPGIQVAVRHGRDLLFSYASGVADTSTGETLTSDHVFRIASHSKTFTATLIMQLVEQGRLRLDDAVAEIIPALADAAVGRVSVRALLGHQAGVERDGVDANWWQLHKAFPTRDELIAELQRDAVFAANTHFHYSNLAYSLLGLIIEQITGHSFADAAQRLTPTLSEWIGTRALVGPELGTGPTAALASGHGIPASEWDADSPETTPPVIAPTDTVAQAAATGYWGNAETVSGWLSAHALGTGVFLTDDTKRLMQRRESQITKTGVTRWYGLGWIQRDIGERHVIGHSGGFPGHITQTWGDPVTGLSVSVLTNRIGGPASDLASGLLGLLDKVARIAGDAAGVDAAPDLAGTYRSVWGDVSLIPLPGVVLQTTPATIDPASAAVVMTPDANGALRAAAEDGFADAGEVMQIERDASGAVSAVTITGISFWRPDLFTARRAALLSGEALRP